MTTQKPTILAGIETGGTKFNCVVANTAGEILHQQIFPTRLPEQTLTDVAAYFTSQSQRFGTIGAVGIASFGPVDLDPRSPQFGYILATPKVGWSHYDLRGFFAKTFAAPIGFETDVNGALLGEYTQGAAVGLRHAAYVTIGTGIGAGFLVNGQLLQGLSHPEIGHSFLARHPQDSFIGNCPFHQDCVEGLAAGPAISARWGASERLPPDHPAWPLQAFYLAQLCVNITQFIGPEVIVLGGGVMQAHLFPLIRSEFKRLINCYCSEALLQRLDTYVVPPRLGNDAGQIGALYLAERALQGN